MDILFCQQQKMTAAGLLDKFHKIEYNYTSIYFCKTMIERNIQMKKLIRLGRFAYILPYLMMPLILMLGYAEGFSDAVVISFCLPFGIESPFVLLYPIGWIISIVCFILCAVENKRNHDRKAQIINSLLIGIAILIAVILVALIVYMINHFTIGF